MEQTIRDWARAHGYQIAWGPGGVVAAAHTDLEERERHGEIDLAFAAKNLPSGSERVPAGWRVLVVAMPRPAHLVGFRVGGRLVQVVMPPTYERYRPLFDDIGRELREGPLGGWQVVVLNAPLKAVASRLGLVRYGRNNVTYAEGIGSYLQLLGYATDAPLTVPAGWQPTAPRLLDECESCAICAERCPTGAIPDDRILLHAERCLTLASESAGPWPSHVPAGSHHCLIGCLRCQEDCPANPTLQVARSGVEFDEAETEALLREGDHAGDAWIGIREKLLVLGQPYQEDVIGRNLRALLWQGAR